MLLDIKWPSPLSCPLTAALPDLVRCLLRANTRDMDPQAEPRPRLVLPARGRMPTRADSLSPGLDSCSTDLITSITLISCNKRDLTAFSRTLVIIYFFKSDEIQKQYISNLESEPASMERVKGEALLCGDRVGLQSRGVLTMEVTFLIAIVTLYVIITKMVIGVHLRW